MNYSSFLKYMPIFLIAFFTISIYWNSYNFLLISFWDNPGYTYIENNTLINSLAFSNIIKIFSQPFDNHYHPFALLSLAIDYNFGNGNLLVFRISNLLIFSLTAYFIFLFFSSLSNNKRIGLLTALIFIVHPYNVESVLWLSERKNLLFALFFFISAWQYLIYINNNKNYNLFLTSLFFLFSLLSKAQGLPLIAIFFLVDYAKNRIISKKLIIEKIPLIFISIIFIYLASWAHNPSEFTRTHPEKLSDYFFAGSHNLFFYFFKTYVPYSFSAYYPYPEVESLISTFWIYPIILIILAITSYLLFRNDKFVLFGLLFFLINIGPLLKLIPIPYGNYLMADRYMLVPITGIAFFSTYLYENKFIIKNGTIKNIIVAIYIILLSVFSHFETYKWKDSISFYDSLIKKYPNMISAIGNKGRVLMHEKDFDNAIIYFSKAIHINPSISNLYVNRGISYAKINKYNHALNDFSLALSIDNLNFQAYNNKGYLLLLSGEFKLSLENINKAINIKPDFAEAWFNKALIYNELNHMDSTIHCLNKAIKNNFTDYNRVNILRNKINSKL